ncbi:myosin-6-like isoform X2 [Silene latifolia]
MDVVGIAPDEQDAIFRVVAAILHIGNIEFKKGSEPDSSEPKDEKSVFHLKTASELFMCDEKALEDSFCKRVIVTRGESITKNLDPVAASVNRDALAKTVYSRLFDWLVNNINRSIGQDPDSKSLIGVLDIYGFETFKTNSFEQFCINLTNEKLQQHFNQHVFKMEQEEYTREEIDWSYIEFVDNQDVLDLIEKKPGGIIALLDEACMFPRSTHETFAEKLYQTFSNHKRFSKPKLSRTDFTISHYAGEVTYQTELFLDKNKDYVVAEHQELLGASKCAFVASLFPPLPEETSKSSKFSSIGTGFKQQLQALLETLSSTEPHYIRCIKPNNLLKPAIFENGNILQQLRCGGVMEAIRISCAGFPTRRPFLDFINRCRILAPEVLNGSRDDVTACRKILEKVQLKGYQIGKTKVFLRAGQMAELDALRNEVLGRSATVIQKQVRTFFYHRWFGQMRLSAITIQAYTRGEVARCLFEHKKKERASVRIQKESRKYLARKSYLAFCSSAVSIQRGMRGMAARSELLFRKRRKAAILIQCQYKRHAARRQFTRMRKAAIVTQCAWRAKLARRELRKLKMAAKETGALQDAKNKLEKQVEELTLCLQHEKRLRADLEETKKQENSKLQLALDEMQRQYQETKTLLMKEREENVDKTGKQDQETKTLLTRGEENVNKTGEQGHETKSLLTEGEENVNKTGEQGHETKSLLTEGEENVNKTGEQGQEAKSMLTEVDENVNKTGKQGQETKTLLTKEEENVNKTGELVPVIQEVPVVDNDLVNKLTKENEQLKELVCSLEKKIDEVEKKYEETSKLSEERLKQAQDAESKIIQLKTTIQRLDEKIADMETEDYVLRQQALKSSSRRMSEHPELPSGTPRKNFGTESLRKSQMERQRELSDSLIKCVAGDVGFSQGKPVAAFTMYKCLLHWKSFEAERTNVFDRLIQLIGSKIENSDDNCHLAYWLSNTSTLLFLLQRSLKSSKDWKPPQPTSFFGRMAQGFRSSPSSANIQLDIVRAVEAKYPALLFKQQLTAYVEKIFGIVRDNFKKEISPLLSSCIQATRIAQGDTSLPIPVENHWRNIIENLQKFLDILKENHVPKNLVQNIFTQIFLFINVQLFNSLFMRQECCTFSNGEYMKAGLDELETWCQEATEEFVGSSWDELKHTRQAVGFLVIPQKSDITYDDLTNNLCPLLSVQQLCRICTLYRDDSDNTQSVSSDVISSMRAVMTGEDKSEDSETTNDAFLLDDTSSMPFSVDELSASQEDRDFAGVKAPLSLVENPDFQFLQD